MTVGRSWWMRPQVDWSLKGELKCPHYDRSTYLTGPMVLSNFGDGPAHRVSVHIRRGDALKSQTLATSPLVKPGDVVEFEAGCSPKYFDGTYIWVTWTPPPIRRRREATSQHIFLKDHVTLSDMASGKLKAWRDSQQQGENS